MMLRCGRVYGTPVPLNTVHRWISAETIGWLWLAWSAGWSDGLDERSVDLVWRGTLKIGTSDDVAQRDQILEYFKGWDWFGFLLGVVSPIVAY
jgi:hypothetical protein